MDVKMKEAYIRMRNNGKVDEQLMFKYYIEKGGKLRDIKQFVDSFYHEYHKIDFMGQDHYQKTQRDINKVIEKLDKEFEVITLWSTDGEFIKAY